MLVLYLADQLLKQILGGHHAAQAAILIDNKGDMNPFTLHLLEQIINHLPFRHIKRRPDNRLQAERRIPHHLPEESPWHE